MRERRTKLATTLGALHGALLVCAFASTAHASRADTKNRAAGVCAATSASANLASNPSANLAASASRTAESVPASDDDLPWCVSANDPRCAPLHHDAVAPKLAARVLITAHVGSELRPLPAVEQPLYTTDAGLCACAGYETRVERPPRALGGCSI